MLRVMRSVMPSAVPSRPGSAPAGKVVVNRLGVRESVASRGAADAQAPTGVVTVGYVGRFEDVKGVVDLAEAMRRVPADLPLRLEFRGPAQTPADRDTQSDDCRDARGRSAG